MQIVWYDIKVISQNMAYSQDLWYLSLFILKNEYIKSVAKKKMWIIKSKKWRVVKFYSTNKLLWNWIIWLKTWTTDNAGQCLSNCNKIISI